MLQLSLFGNESLTAILEEINQIHSATPDCYLGRATKEYTPHFYENGDLLLATYLKDKDGINGEKIINKSIYLDKQPNGCFKIAFFDSYVLGGIVDKRRPSKLLKAFLEQTEIINDLKKD